MTKKLWIALPATLSLQDPQSLEIHGAALLES